MFKLFGACHKPHGFNCNEMKIKLFPILAMLLVAVYSCNKDNNYIYYHSNKASFYVKDLNTDDSLQNNPDFTIWNTLKVHRNDRLLFVYNAPQGYNSGRFTITYNAFGEKSVAIEDGNQSSQRIIVVEPNLTDSSYLIQCEAISDEWLEESYDKGFVMVQLVE